MINLTLHPGQEKVMATTSRFIGVVSGIQGGKTTIGAIWLLREIQEARTAGKTGDWLIAAPTAKIIQQSTLPKFRSFFPSDWGVWREARQCFELAWGGTIYVRSTDNPDHLEGMTLLGAWLDEAGQMKERVWINIQGRLSIHMGRCIMTTTPYNMGWFYREIVKKAGLGTGVELISWGSADNPAFSSIELERAKLSLTTAEFQRRYLGAFVRLEGLVYPNYEPDEAIVEPFEIPSNWSRFAGMDFGFSMPTVVLCVAEDPLEHIFYIYKEYHKTENMLKSVADFISSENLKYVLADPQGAQQIAELNRFYRCGNVKAADNDVRVGIERIGGLLKQNRLKFFKGRCTNTLEEIEEYHWKTNDDKASTKDAPEKKNDHCMDALRYAFSKATIGLYPNTITEKSTLRQRVRIRLKQENEVADRYTGY